MDIVNIIRKKKNGDDLTEEEIRHFVLGSAEGKIHPAQIGAMLMAIALKGLTNRETYNLTKTMIESGSKLKWKFPAGDKHSTGGVGDKISIALVPALAATGLRIPMVSGRSLDFTGGTLDKLESIPGFKTEISVEEMDSALEQCGCFICGTATWLCPADKVLYGIRDTTATVDSIPLILGSILSKKVAAGANFFIQDLKVGKATCFKSLEDAKVLAVKMLELSKLFCLDTKVVFTRMEEPIGNYIGNALEIKECLDVMKGGGPSDLLKLIYTLGGELLKMSEIASSSKEGREMIEKVLTNGDALSHFKNMLICQSVDDKIANELCYGDPWLVLKRSKLQTPFVAERQGLVQSVDALAIGEAVKELGGGRKAPGEEVDHSVGVVLHKKKGSPVTKGEPWLTIHHNSELKKCIVAKIEKAVRISNNAVDEEDIIIEIMDSSNVS